MAIDHSILVKSSGGNPEPVGISADPNQPCPTQNPWNPLICQYTCTECGKDIWVYWDGMWFSLTDGTVWPGAGPNSTDVATPDEVDDMTFGALYIHYDPPIDGV
jgi:hypothetical protein